METVTRYAYVNTESEAGFPEKVAIPVNEIVAIKVWINSYGNPSYVFHMEDETTYFIVDDYGAMNGIRGIARTPVKRKKDLFNRFAGV